MYEIKASVEGPTWERMDELWEHSQRLRTQMDADAHLMVYLVQGDQLQAAHDLVEDYFDKLALWTELVQQRTDLRDALLGCA